MIAIKRLIPVPSTGLGGRGGGLVAVVVVAPVRAVVECGCLHLKVMDDHRGF